MIRSRIHKLIAEDHSHSVVLQSLQNVGYRYQGKKTTDSHTLHTLKYHQKASYDHNARVKSVLTKHGFVHTKLANGHNYKRADAEIGIKSVTGATRLQYLHRN
jgi:hypothetical protein